MIKKIIKDTDPDVLVSHLRAEIGYIIDSWILYRHYKLASQQLQTADISADMKNPNLNLCYLVLEKFRNDIISRVAEVADKKVGQLTFHFLSRKLKALSQETEIFEKFVKDNKFTDRRNNYISHKKLHATWADNKAPHRISFKTMTKGIAMAIRLMKQFDIIYHGDRIKRQWHLVRKTRYDFSAPRVSQYMILPYIIDNSSE